MERNSSRAGSAGRQAVMIVASRGFSRVLILILVVVLVIVSSGIFLKFNVTYT